LPVLYDICMFTIHLSCLMLSAVSPNIHVICRISKIIFSKSSVPSIVQLSLISLLCNRTTFNYSSQMLSNCHFEPLLGCSQAFIPLPLLLLISLYCVMQPHRTVLFFPYRRLSVKLRTVHSGPLHLTSLKFADIVSKLKIPCNA
jgi:hypothetical protein